MAKVLILLLCLLFLSGCDTGSSFWRMPTYYILGQKIALDGEPRKLRTTPEGVMRIISATLEMNQGELQSIEEVMNVVVTEHGHACASVTDIYLADPKNPKGTDLIVTCFDGQTRKNYRLTQSRDGQWSSVIPIDSHFGDSVEEYFHLILFGQGFKCSKVSELFIINADKAYHAICIEGKYRMVIKRLKHHPLAT